MLSLDEPPLYLDLLALPRPLALAIFALLPVDTRLRCIEVNRAWRALLADTSFWRSLTLSVDNALSLPLLRAAAAKAGGQLRSLEISGRPEAGTQEDADLHNLLREVVAANAATLTELRLDIDVRPAHEARALLHAAPALRLLEISVRIFNNHQLAGAMLRKEPPFQALRLRQLNLFQGPSASAGVVAFASDLQCHASLKVLLLHEAALDTAAAMGAVVDACIFLRLHTFRLWECRVVPATLPQLSRLIAAGALRELEVHNNGVQMFDATHASTRLFVAAVRASAMTSLRLLDLGDVPANIVEAAEFINARQH